MPAAFATASPLVENPTSGPITPATPLGSSPGDALLTQVYAAGGQTIPTPAGSELLLTQVGTTGKRMSVFLRRHADGEDAPSYTTSGGSGLYGACSRYTDVDLAAAVEAAVAAAGASTSPTAPSATSTTPDALAVHLFGQDDNWFLGSPNNGATLAYGGSDYSATAGGDGALAGAYKALPAPGASGATAVASTNPQSRNAWIAATIILRAAPAPGPVVDAGPDEPRHFLGTAFTRTATIDPNGSAVTAESWTIAAGPTQVGTTLSTTETVSWTPTAVGAYVLRVSATNADGTRTDDIAITVVDPAVPVWSADFESGVIGDYAILTNPGDYASPNFADIETGTAFLGTRALRSTVNSGTSTGRAEREWLSPDFLPGDDYWFGYRVRLDPNVQVDPPGFQLVMQFKNAGTGSPPVALHVENGRFQLQGGFGFPGGSRSMPTQDLGPATTGVYIDWIFYVEFREGPDAGLVSVWRDGVQLLDSFTPPGGTLYPLAEGPSSYWKSGLYRSTSNATPATVHIDELRIGYARPAVDLAPTSIALTTRRSRAATRARLSALTSTTQITTTPARVGTAARQVVTNARTTLATSAARGTAAAQQVPLAQAHGVDAARARATVTAHPVTPTSRQPLAVDAARAATSTASPALDQQHPTPSIRAVRSDTAATTAALAQRIDTLALPARSATACRPALLGQVTPTGTAPASAPTSVAAVPLAQSSPLTVRSARVVPDASRVLLRTSGGMATTRARSTPRAARVTLPQHSPLATDPAAATSRVDSPRLAQRQPVTPAAARAATAATAAALAQTHPITTTGARTAARASTVRLLGAGAVPTVPATAATAAHPVTLTAHATLSIRPARAATSAGTPSTAPRLPITTRPARTAATTSRPELAARATLTVTPARSRPGSGLATLAQHCPVTPRTARAATATAAPRTTSGFATRPAPARAATAAAPVALAQHHRLAVRHARATTGGRVGDTAVIPSPSRTLRVAPESRALTATLGPPAGVYADALSR